MCESICPVDAIRYADEVEEDELPFVDLNAAPFRDETGTVQEPGGWSKKHPPVKDPANLQEITDQVRTRIESAKAS